jgi:hypothetical protein
MASIDEAIAEIDRQIGAVETNLTTLHREVQGGNVTGGALASLQDFINMAEGRLEGLRTHRAELERQRDGGKQ